MNCPYCNTEVPPGREICPNNDCYKPLKPLPVSPGGKIRFGKYDWYVLDKQNGKTLILTEKVIGRKAYHNQVCEITWETSDMRKYLNGEFYNSFNKTDPCDWCKDEYWPWLGGDGYDINRPSRRRYRYGRMVETPHTRRKRTFGGASHG